MTMRTRVREHVHALLLPKASNNAINANVRACMHVKPPHPSVSTLLFLAHACFMYRAVHGDRPGRAGTMGR